MKKYPFIGIALLLLGHFINTLCMECGLQAYYDIYVKTLLKNSLLLDSETKTFNKRITEKATQHFDYMHNKSLSEEQKDTAIKLFPHMVSHLNSSLRKSQTHAASQILQQKQLHCLSLCSLCIFAGTIGIYTAYKTNFFTYINNVASYKKYAPFLGIYCFGRLYRCILNKKNTENKARNIGIDMQMIKPLIQTYKQFEFCLDSSNQPSIQFNTCASEPVSLENTPSPSWIKKACCWIMHVIW